MRPLLDYDLGPEFNYQDASGVLKAPPKVKRSLPQLVVKVDADGNEVAGVKSPLQAAPLGTYTGWNVTAAGPLKGQVVRPARRVHPVREDEGRTAGEGRPAAVARGAVPLARRIRPDRQRRSGQTGAGAVSAAAGRRRDDQAGRGQRRPSLSG